MGYKLGCIKKERTQLFPSSDRARKRHVFAFQIVVNHVLSPPTPRKPFTNVLRLKININLFTEFCNSPLTEDSQEGDY